MWPCSPDSYLWNTQSAISVGAGNMGTTTRRTRCEKSTRRPPTLWALCLWPILPSCCEASIPVAPYYFFYCGGSPTGDEHLGRVFDLISGSHRDTWRWPKPWISAHGWDWRCAPLPLQESSGGLCGHWCPSIPVWIERYPQPQHLKAWLSRSL